MPEPAPCAVQIGRIVRDDDPEEDEDDHQSDGYSEEDEYPRLYEY